MSLGIDDFRDPDNPITKKPRDLAGPGGNPIPSGPPATFGFGGGNAPGTFGLASVGGDSGALRSLLRKRLALPATQPSYLTSAPGSASMTMDLPPDESVGVGQASAGAGGGGGLSMSDWRTGRKRRALNPNGTGTDWVPPGSNPSGDPTIDLNEWSGTGWDQSRTLNRLYDLLSQFDKSGSFSPGGNKGLMDFARTEALGNAEAIRQRNSLIGNNLGVDPATGASFALQSDLNSQGGVADAMNAASRGVLERQDAFGKDILSMLANLNAQDWMAERQGDISKRYAPDQGGGGVGGYLGNIGGRALGGWLGGRWG